MRDDRATRQMQLIVATFDAELKKKHYTVINYAQRSTIRELRNPRNESTRWCKIIRRCNKLEGKRS